MKGDGSQDGGAVSGGGAWVAEISLSLDVGRAVVAPCLRGDARKDGTSRLSPFELTDDMVQRTAVMVKLLPEGASAESEPTRGGID